MTTEEASWLACAIDGEGSITYGHRQRWILFKVQVANTKIEFLEFAKQITGCGQIYGYKWVVYRLADIEAILKQVLPFLIIKRHQAELVLKIAESKESNSVERFEVMEEVKRLNNN